MQLINYWVGEKYTLRYTGGMVPDVGQVRIVLKYSHSWYSNPLGSILHGEYSQKMESELGLCNVGSEISSGARWIKVRVVGESF